MFKIKTTEIIAQFRKKGILFIIICGITIFKVHYDFEWNGWDGSYPMD